MNDFRTLLFKPLVEWKNNFNKNSLRDVWGAILSIVLAVALFFAYIVVGLATIKGYIQIKVDGQIDMVSRAREAITMLYGVIILAGVCSSIKEINNRLFENEDTKIYLTLPIKSITLFMSQLVIIYIKQFFKTILYVMSVSIMFEIVMPQGADFILTSIVTCLLIPFLTIGLASFLVFPFYYFKRILGGRHIITLILTTAVVGVLFWGYSYILDIFSQLLASGEIKFFFSQKTMDLIGSITHYLYPANIYCDFTMGIHRWQNCLIIIAIAIFFSAIGYLICSLCYRSILQEKVTGRHIPDKYLNLAAYTQPTFGALLLKEFITVLRTPSYAFEYFSTAIVMPLMVVLCMKIGNTFLSNLVAINCNLELAIFCIMIFSMLTNTFCATNISRDGSGFWLVKTFPIDPKKYLLSKVVFCSIISTVSVLISIIVIVAMNFVTILQGAYIGLIGCVFAFSQILYATKCDLKKPHFVNDDLGEVVESNSTINKIILLGMLNAIIVGGGILLVKVILGLKGIKASKVAIDLSILAIATIEIVGALIMFFRNIEKHYNSLTEGN